MSGLEYHAGRLFYTQVKRHVGSSTLPIAVNAAPASEVIPMEAMNNGGSGSISTISSTSTSSAAASNLSHMENSSASSVDLVPNEKDKDAYGVQLDAMSTTSSEQDDERELPAVAKLSHPIAILPQYIAWQPTTIVLHETELPKRGHSFSVSLSQDGREVEEIFRVQREYPSFSHRQNIIDARTGLAVMCVRQDVGALPRSFRFDDIEDNKVLDLQGNFFVPTQGLRATALFENAAGKGLDGARTHSNHVKLKMRGRWRNRAAVIKNTVTDEVLATMKSEVVSVKSVGHRRTFTVEVSMGVDLTLVIGMILALDSRY